EVDELMLEEDEAEGVFEDAAFRVVREVLFEVEVLDVLDGSFGIADLTEDFTGFFGVEAFEFGAPLEVASLGEGIFAAGDLPAAEVLAAGGEAEFFAGVGGEFEDPVGEPLGVKEFAGMGNA